MRRVWVKVLILLVLVAAIVPPIVIMVIMDGALRVALGFAVLVLYALALAALPSGDSRDR